MFRRLLLAFAVGCGAVSLAGAADDAKKKKKDPSAELERIYKMLDANSDGKLSADEFKNLPTVHPLPKKDKAAPDLDAVFKKLDADKDMSLSADEFKKLADEVKGRKKKDK